ncbi:MAG: ATP-grasp domain-containing protein [Bacteroidetes bacterium]|nr:ATP-grasp domain-containing protein [Bacteroidota bacterium]
MSRPRVNIAVTGLNAVDSPGPGVPVIRGLHEALSFEANVTGLAYEALEPGIYMDGLVNKSYLIPYPTEGIDSLRDRLLYIHQKEHLDVIIPNFDAELFSFMKLAPELEQHGIHMFLPTLDQFEERQKANLSAFGKKHGIDVPESLTIHSLSELEKTVKSMDFPLMIKGRYYEAYIAHTLEQAKGYYAKISAKWGVPVIVQKFVKGTELNVTGLGDGSGQTIAAVAMRKQFITDKGKAWAGITINDPDLLKITRNFISSTHWRGAFELEIMKSDNGKCYLMEINPRIPAWVYLAIATGQNIPEALVNLALGKPVSPYESYEVGKLFIRYSYDMIVERNNFEQLSVNGEFKQI